MLSPRSYLILALGLSVFIILFSLTLGSRFISPHLLFFQQDSLNHSILFELRMPRIGAAFICGALLALAGLLMQLLLHNPMADPYALGISGGAAFFSLLFITLGFTNSSLLGGAWLGSLIVIGCIFLLSRQHRFETHALLLCGIALAFAFSAGISTLLLLNHAAHVRPLLFWLSGDLNIVHFPYWGLFMLIGTYILCQMLTPALNLLGRGEYSARALGLSTTRLRILLYLLSSLLAATAVSIAGCIGFIGLIIPHLSRKLGGYDHRYTLPLSLLLGGSLLTFADALSRSLFSPQQLPVGIIMAIIGIPIFIGLLKK